MLYFVAVLDTNKQDFMILSDMQKDANEDNVLRLEGLPWNSKENDIRQFFDGEQIQCKVYYKVSNFLIHFGMWIIQYSVCT